MPLRRILPLLAAAGALLCSLVFSAPAQAQATCPGFYSPPVGITTSYLQADRLFSDVVSTYGHLVVRQPGVKVTHTGGIVNVNGDLRLQDHQTEWAISGGTLSVNGRIHVGGNYDLPYNGQTYFNQTGGIVHANVLSLGTSYHTGHFRLAGGEFRVGHIIPATKGGLMRLDGGLLVTSCAQTGSGNYSPHNVYFNGTRVRAQDGYSNQVWFQSAATTNVPLGYYIGNGGALFDTAAQNMGIPADLQHLPDANAIDGGLLKLGSGSLRLSGNNSYTGRTGIDEGTLIVDSSANLGAANNGFGLWGGTLRIEGTTFNSLASRTVDVAYFTGTIDIAHAGNTFTIPHSAGNGNHTSFTKTGPGTLVLTGQNNWSNGTHVNQGTLRLGGVSGDGTGTLRGDLTVTGATVELSAVDTMGYATYHKINNVQLNSAVLDNLAAGNNGWGVAYLLLASEIRSNGGVTSTTSPSNLTFGNYSSLRVRGGTPSSIRGHVHLRSEAGQNSDFTVDENYLNVFAGISSGPGAAGITKKGDGVMALLSANTFSGNSVVQQGELAVVHPQALQNSTAVLDGGVLAFRNVNAATLGGLAGAQPLPLHNTDGVNVALSVGNNGNNTSYGGSLSGGGSLTKIGTGTLTLNGLSSHGTTTVSAGRLVLNANAGNGSGTLRGSLTVNANGIVQAAVVDALGWGDGVKLTNIAINGGLLENTATGNNGWGVAYALNGGTLRSNGGTASTSAASNLSFGGPAGSNTSVSASGSTPSTIAGHVNLRGDNGNTGVNFTVSSDARLNVPAGISGTANVGLNKLGAGLMALEFASNTYLGATQVTAGTLLVNGSTGPGMVTVASGATLAGGGQVRGTTTVHSGGRIAPGSTVGTLTFSNGLTLNDGTVATFDLGSSSDRVRISGGTFTGSGNGGVTLHFTDSGGFAPGTYTLFDFAGATASGVGAADFTLGSVVPGPYDYAIGMTATSVVLAVTLRDIEPPVISGVGVPASRIYRAGEALDFTVAFNEPVFVSGAPRLPLVLDSGTVGAAYVSGSGGSALLFRYVTASGDTDANGIALGTALALNGGGLADAANNAAVLTLNGVPSTSGIRIDTTPPSVLSISIVGSPAASSPAVDFAIQFSEAVEGVDAQDFAVVAPSGTAAGQITQLSGSGASYSVTVSDITGYGQLRVDLRNSDTGITDLAGNAIASGFTGGQAFAADAMRPLCHVDARAQGANTGNSWGNAYIDLHSALSAPVRCEAIWIAGGVYRPGGSGFAIHRPVRIHGGFAGNETHLAERTPAVIAAHPTVLSGDVDGDDAVDARGIVVDAADQMGNNRSVVVDLIAPPYSANDTVLDGLVITGAAEHGLRCLANGPGHACDYVLTNMVFSGNRGAQGAALHNVANAGGAARPVLDRVLFRGNHASLEAAALYNAAHGTGAVASPALSHVVFTGNHGSSIVATMADGGTAQPRFDHVVLYDNRLVGTADAGIVNAALAGGHAHIVLRNSIVWGNEGIAVDNQGLATAAFRHSIVQGFGDSGTGWVGNGSDLGGNRNADPVLGGLGDFGGAIPGLRPGAGSAAIDAGDDCASEDYRGVVRPQGAGCDIGATEVRQHVLNVAVQGAGTVVSETAVIGAGFGMCTGASTTCTARYPEHATVALTATPALHSHLLGWGGDCNAQGGLAMNGDRQCTAQFADNTLTLALSRSVGSTPTAYGAPLEFTAVLTPVAPAVAQPTGTVHFYVGSHLLGSADVNDGVARLQASGLLGVGDHSVEARHAGDSHYFASAQPPSNVLVQQIVAAQGTVSFESLAFTYDGNLHTPDARLTEDLAAVCTITPAQIGPDAGSYPVSAICSGSQYTAAGTATAVIGRATGTVEFEALGFTYDGSQHPVRARIAEEPSSACDLSPAAVGPGAGTYPVSAICSGVNYQATGHSTAMVERAVGTVEFTALSFTYDGSTKQPIAHIGEEPATSCSIAPASIGPGAGDWPVSANCNGVDYQATGEAVAHIARAAQSIDFPAPAEQALTHPHLELSATASSGLPVDFTVSPSTVCTSLGANVTLHAVGHCTVRANQSGDANHAPADEVAHSFSVVQGNTPPRIHAPGPQSMLEDGVLDGVIVTVEDDETAPSALTLVARSSDPALIADSGLHLSGSGITRLLRITPQPDAFGTATITLTVGDGEGLTADALLTVNVLPVNDAPTLTLSSTRLAHTPGNPGTHAVPGFASATPGPANEAGQTLSYSLMVLADPQAVLSTSDITANGRLDYALTGHAGAALLRLTVTDDGGQANGGIDRTHRDFRIVVTSGADVVLRLRRSAPGLSLPVPGPSGAASTVEYTIEATNHGPSALTGTTLMARSSAALGNLLWLCDPVPACTPASGGLPGAGPHSLSTALALGVGQTAVLTLSGEIDSTALWLELAAEAILPAALRPPGGNPRVVLIEPISADAVFRDGFE